MRLKNTDTPQEDRLYTGQVDKDTPLREDIRLLGRLLGEVIRSQEGQDIFDVVESIRRISVRFHRNEDVEAREQLEEILGGLTPEQDGIRRGLVSREAISQITSA